jgi:hypothetical protein
MGAVEPIDLPETGLIIGDNFPTHDETAYSREADNQRSSAEHAAAAGDTTLAAARYTDPEFRGQAGGALATKLTNHHQTLSADQARHANVASWLDLGAENITHTKTAMNQITADYHDTYDTLCQRAHDETWPQHRLRAEKDQAVTDAQSRIRAARTDFEDRHRTIRNGIASGADPDQSVKEAAYVPPKPPPPAPPKPALCYIGTEDGDLSQCPPDTDTVTYVDKDGNYASKDLNSGVVTVMHRPGPIEGPPTVCWMPSANADRSICGPNTTSWMYPRDGHIITDEIGPDGKAHTRFNTPQGPLIP